MKIPNKIKGFGFEYRVIQKKNLKDKEGKWQGLISPKKGIISIEKIAHQGRKEQTLLHELIHFVNIEHRIKMKEIDVDRLATGLYSILKDNKLLK